MEKTEREMSVGRTAGEAGLGEGGGSATNPYDQEFWRIENLKFGQPWYRLEKSARLVASLAAGRSCALLDVGCGPGTLMRLLPANVKYFGIDIAIQDPAPNLLEVDLLENPISFEGKHFDIVIAEGVFEYLGDTQQQKFAEIAQILGPSGTFVTTYTNFEHRKKYVSPLFSNVGSLSDFQSDLGKYFTIDRVIPEAHNWKHQQPNRRWVRALNLHLNRPIPWVSRRLAVEYYFVCSLKRQP